jgi:hypothetical protein
MNPPDESALSPYLKIFSNTGTRMVPGRISTRYDHALIECPVRQGARLIAGNIQLAGGAAALALSGIAWPSIPGRKKF